MTQVQPARKLSDDKELQDLWIFYAVERNKARTDGSLVSDLKAEMEGIRAVAEKVWDEKTEHQAVHGENPWRREQPSNYEVIAERLDSLNEALNALPGPPEGISLQVDKRTGRLIDAVIVPAPVVRQEKK